MTDPVLRWAGAAKSASQQTGIPADVLLGLVSVESGGREGLTSPAGAQGLTQFMPGTAASYHVNTAPGHADSQLLGAAHYLVDLGFLKNPDLALRKYNAGPNASSSVLNSTPVAGYARNVLARAETYAGAGGTSSASTSTASTSTPSSSGSASLFGANVRSGAVRALLYTALAGAGVVLAGLGLTRATGAST